MADPVGGLHHITIIAGDPQTNVDFYTTILGLRLVKITVNFDDPSTYHLYYGDGLGRPGTILTFFPWPAMPRGTRGTGEINSLALSVPATSLEQWSAHLGNHSLLYTQEESAFGEPLLSFRDPDGLQLQLVGIGDDERPGWSDGPLAAGMAIRGMHAVSLAVEGYERTAGTMVTQLGFEPVAERGNRFRYRAAGQEHGAFADIVCTPDTHPHRMGSGTVHHVAWRCRDDAHEAALRERLASAGVNITPQIDRQYFHSVYFREPGGVLFELATDPPGFAIDEPVEELGQSLQLPPQYEARRSEIEAVLPKLQLPRYS